MATILLIDDEPTVPLANLKTLRPTDKLLVGQSGAEGLALAQTHSPDVVLLDLMLPDINGIEVFLQLHRLDDRLPVIFITTTTHADAAIRAMAMGAFDYLTKPFDLSQLQSLLDIALTVSQLAHRPTVGDRQSLNKTNQTLVGKSAAMREVFKAIGRVAGQAVPVLITGESGTGKELVAHAIHQHSNRHDRPFLAINCAAMPETLIESELFGYEKGAFTGALRQRIGKFEQADGGTLFLDEIGELTLGGQAKLLRVLQDGSFQRLGGDQIIHTNVRLIAATNRDLAALVAEGQFRRDLYFRLAVFTIHLPPLRERPDDIAELAYYFLQRYAVELQRPVREISLRALDRLCQYSWPGNVRELQSVIKQALMRATGGVVLAEFLPAYFCNSSPNPPKIAAQSQSTALNAGQPSTNVALTQWLTQLVQQSLAKGTTTLYDEVISQVERELIALVMAHTRGNQLEACRILGLSPKTLRSRLRSSSATPSPTNDRHR